MKIVSLLPSGTEIVFALGLGGALEGVTFECDHPPEARTKPVVSGTSLAGDALASPLAIDIAVRARVAAGEPIYTLDVERIRAIAPDLIITQDLCRVCAVPAGAVHDALALLGCHADVVSLDPSSLDDVIGSVDMVGRATGAVPEAAALTAQLRRRLDSVRDRVADAPRGRVLALEWTDPPYSAGHWVPDMIAAAGGEPLLADAGARSRVLDWPTVAAQPADVLIVMPCGFHLDRAVEAASTIIDRPELAGIPEVWAVEADAYFSRPGPRLVNGVELLAELLHEGAIEIPHAAERLRSGSRSPGLEAVANGRQRAHVAQTVPGRTSVR